MQIFNEDGLSEEFFSFLRYNQIGQDIKLSETDKAIYDEANKKLMLLKSSLEENEKLSITLLGSIMSMFGFNRHYCSVSGIPIIGKYYKIGGKIVSQEAYESYQIIQEMEKTLPLKNEKKRVQKKTSSKPTRPKSKSGESHG